MSDVPPVNPLAPEVTRLRDIVARLRGPGGCPWDREQTPASLRPYVLEEAHEVLEALDRADPAKIREELGDLLFQVVLHAQLAEERGEFDLALVARTIADKLVRRHPHVFTGGGGNPLPRPPLPAAGAFGDEAAITSAEVLVRWEELKRAERAEKGEPASILAGVPLALPALARAHKVQERAARVGFDWTAAREVLAKLDEERAELGRALDSGDRGAVEHELGDVLFTVVNLARHAGVNAEDALRVAVQRFTARFQHMEAAAERSLQGLGPAELDRLWARAKSAVG